MITVSNLAFSYPNQQMLSWPNFSTKASEKNVLVLLGPSGCGKTTLLHLIAGLLKPLKGEISVLDQRIDQMSRKECDAFRGKNMGLLFQETHYWESLTMAENLALASSLAGNSKDSASILSRLADLGIDNLENKKPHHCSVGERQRLGVAMATIHEPKIVLADEPTSALDDVNCTKVLDLLENEVINKGAFLLIISHDKRITNRFNNVIDLSRAAV
jgi:putative ABC transport system ATP-binding protein